MRDFRFGVNVLAIDGDFPSWARAVEDAGVDVLAVPDHLGMPGPFPALVSAADVTSRLRLGTFVLNGGFYSPALLARDCATADLLTGGRLEIGVGAGYVEDEFVAAGLRFPSAGERVAHLTDVVTHLRSELSRPGYQPAPVQSPPPIMVAGVGDKVLTLAAEQADIVAFSAVPDEQTLAERVAFVRDRSGDRFDRLELNLIILEFAVDQEPDYTLLRQFIPDATDDQLRNSMNALIGSFDEVVAKVNRLRDEYGVSYFIVIGPDRARLDDLARVIEAVG